MRMLANTEFDDKTDSNSLLVFKVQHLIPEEFRNEYYKVVVKYTPAKTFRLRRSIRSQVLGNTATIWWQAPYASAQNVGHHTVSKYIRGENKRDGGYGTIKPGVYYYDKKGMAGSGFREAAAEEVRRGFIEKMKQKHPELF